MSEPETTAPVVVAIEIHDEQLAARLRVLLSGVPGIAIADAGEQSDVSLVQFANDVDGEVALTPRELDVLQLLVQGASNKEIARRLGISASTVKFHVRSIVDKLGADGRTDAVANAMRRGIIHL